MKFVLQMIEIRTILAKSEACMQKIDGTSRILKVLFLHDLRNFASRLDETADFRDP